MSFEDAEIHNCGPNPPKSKIRGVIVLTDNRVPILAEKSNSNDFSCSASKETEVDLHEFSTAMSNDPHDDDIIAKLTRRVTLLEEKIEALSKCDVPSRSAGESSGDKENKSRKKNRRKFKQLVRDNMCPHCQKMYGSDTALKCHLKLKHRASNHSQVQ